MFAGLASCVNEDLHTSLDEVNTSLDEVKGEKGIMKLNVAIAEPLSYTRANSAYTDEQLAAMPKATDYPIEIYDAEGNLFKRYEAVSMFPSEGLPMNVGNYTIESHTAGIMEKKMDKHNDLIERVAVCAAVFTPLNADVMVLILPVGSFP